MSELVLDGGHGFSHVADQLLLELSDGRTDPEETWNNRKSAVVKRQQEISLIRRRVDTFSAACSTGAHYGRDRPCTPHGPCTQNKAEDTTTNRETTPNDGSVDRHTPMKH